MLFLTEKLKLKCYVLCQTKELLTINKKCILPLLIFLFLLSVLPELLLLLFLSLSNSITVGTVSVITISIIIAFAKVNLLNVKSGKFLLEFLCHMTSDVKFSHIFFAYLFFVQKLQNSLN